MGRGGVQISERARGLLRLTLVPGLGPVRIARLLEAFGDVGAIERASPGTLARVPGIGDKTARSIAEKLRAADALVEEELGKLDAIGAGVVAIGEAGYPSLLAPVPGAPPVLTVRGQIRDEARDDGDDRYTLAVVGSRRCTAYGIEQAERFGSSMARAGVTIVSGGARGIDVAAHRAALRAGGRTIAMLGCGLARCYPPEHGDLYDQIAGGGPGADRGAVVSELPADAPPDAQNFPARNRIISGMSLGVLVIEAGERSGALITARHAVEDHGREVMALPGRADSDASRGSLGLIKSGGAALVVDPGDVLDALEQAARHRFEGTHDAMTADPTRAPLDPAGGERGWCGLEPPPENFGVSDEGAALLGALDGAARTADQLMSATGLDAGTVRRELTMLELHKRVRRRGSAYERV